MKIGDMVFVHGYVDEIRKDTVIIRNQGGYFGTVPSEILTGDFINCCDCKHYDATKKWCDWMCMYFPENGFCSKRKPKSK